MGNRSTQERRFVLHPGDVISRTDGQRHYVGVLQLSKLYGVPMANCVIYPGRDDPRRLYWRDPVGAIHLHPRYDGDYSLPAEPLL